MRAKTITENDRLAIRSRPSASPVMYQTWGKLLFMHWAIDPQLLRPLIPRQLEIDTYDNKAWLGITPFTMWNVRPVWLPSVPGLSEAHELNVRTYVYRDGVPGVWFLSLDINHTLAAWAARAGYHLPYYVADISLKQEQQRIIYNLKRDQADAPDAAFHATWMIGDRLGEAQPGSLEFFLIERYCLFAADSAGDLYKARIWHHPWPLQSAELLSSSSTMIESHGLPSMFEKPLLHYTEELNVEIFLPKQITD
jgi:uncharacterized protein YqjF (DUF2071 family)